MNVDNQVAWNGMQDQEVELQEFQPNDQAQNSRRTIISTMGPMDDIDSDDGDNRAAKIEVLGQGAYKNPLRNAPTMPM